MTLRRKTMNFKTKKIIIAIVMVVVILAGVIVGAVLATNKPEPTTTTPESTTTTTSGTTTTSKNTYSDFSKYDQSLSKDEILERYTLTREEIDSALAMLDDLVALSNTASTVDEIDALYEEFEDVFYHIAQQMTFASLVYYCDMSDEEATTRHLDTTDMFYEVQDKYMISCRTMYLESPFSEELFADWTEQEINELLEYDPAITELKKEIKELETIYNDLSESKFEKESVNIYKQIIEKNNKIARHFGYANYYDYASERVYGRDYEKEDLKQFKEYVIEYIMPRFSKLNNGFMAYQDLSTTRYDLFYSYVAGEFDSVSNNKNYLLMYLNSLGDTNMGVAMRDVFESKNCVFSSSGNSHPTAFQTYLYEDETPFCLFGSNGQGSSTMVHEIGHYYAAYTNDDLNNYDLCETHSQGNEFLFLQFCKDELPSKVYSPIRYYNLFNAYYVIVVATVMDDFEQRVYSLDDRTIKNMTSEDFDALMDEVLLDYGKNAEWFETNLTNVYDYWRNVVIDNPVYYISYAVSAVAAVEIFSIAEEDYDAAMQAYTTLVEGVTEEDGFLEALRKAGLTTPFEEETFKKVAATMRK